MSRVQEGPHGGYWLSTRQTHHSMARGGLGKKGNEGDKDGGNNTKNFKIAFPEKAAPRPCPVEVCSGRAATQTDMRFHLWHWHVRDTVVILEEGNLPNPRCPLCNMLVPWRALSGIHWCNAQCKKGVEQKRRRLVAEK